MESINNKIFILGGTIVQKDLVEYSKENGFDTHVCGTIIKDNIKEIADHYTFLDICNADSINDYVEKNKIDLVYSLGSDIAITAASSVSEKKSLPMLVSYEKAYLCSNKFLMRTILTDTNIPVPKFQRINSIDDEIKLDFPFVMKPIDSWGQRGVYVVNSFTEFNDFFYKSIKFSGSKNLIIEEYINGPEVSVSVYMIDGEVAFSVIIDRIPIPKQNYGLVLKHQIPSNISITKINNINKLIKSAMNELKIHNGPVYFQIKIKDDIPFIIEITPRLDGCHLWRLIKYYNSLDLLDITIKHLLGEKPVFNYQKKNLKKYKLEFISDYPGKTVDRSNYNYPKDYNYLEWYYNSGERVLPLNEKYEKIGYFITEEAAK